MSDNSYINYTALSDNAVLGKLGSYIKHHRLTQNKTQQQLATEAGINRTTLLDLEQGQRANLLTFIQVLRALKVLDTLKAFEIETQISPILLAEMQQKYRKRASKRNNKPQKPQSDW
ncbi:MAG: helix-turn-helix transcriptional regulator [bacterium]|nr:helix-turn-helix transcriptional regulator [bacterium]